MKTLVLALLVSLFFVPVFASGDHITDFGGDNSVDEQTVERIPVGVIPQVKECVWQERIKRVIPLNRADDTQIIAMEDQAFQAWKLCYNNRLAEGKYFDPADINVGGESPKYYLEIEVEEPEWACHDTSIDLSQLQCLFKTDYRRFCDWYDDNYEDHKVDVTVTFTGSLRSVRTYKQVKDSKGRVIYFKGTGKMSNRSFYALGIAQSKQRDPETLMEIACKNAAKALESDLKGKIKNLSL